MARTKLSMMKLCSKRPPAHPIFDEDKDDSQIDEKSDDKESLRKKPRIIASRHSSDDFDSDYSNNSDREDEPRAITGLPSVNKYFK